MSWSLYIGMKILIVIIYKNIPNNVYNFSLINLCFQQINNTLELFEILFKLHIFSLFKHQKNLITFFDRISVLQFSIIYEKCLCVSIKIYILN